MLEIKTQLLNLLVRESYQYSDTPKFKLSSGIYSNEYFDCKKTLCLPEALPLIGELVYNKILPFPSISFVGGLTMGADPIAIATAYFSENTQNKIKWFSIRKQTKDHGNNRFIVGNVNQGDCVAILEDVITTGASTIEAIEKAQEAGLKIAQVIGMVDREEGGLQNIKHFAGPSVAVTTLFTKTEIKKAFKEGK